MSKPPYIAYSVRDYEKDGKKDSVWTRIGVLFPHRDGKGHDLLLEALPLGGRIVIRANEPKAAPEQNTIPPEPVVTY